MSERDAAIVGVAECDLGETGRTTLELHTQGITRALADAGLSVRDVDGLATNAVSRFPTTQLAEYLGVQPTWTDGTFVGGSSYVAFVARAVEAVRRGQCEVAVVSFASNQRSARSRTLAGTIVQDTPYAQFEQPYGALYPLSMYALAAQRHFHEFGTTEADLARIAVAARSWALRNPAAYRYGAGELTVDDVLASTPISTPIKSLDCCLVTDGGGAVVVTTAERARDLRDNPIRVLGHGECTTHDGMSQMPDLTSTGAVTSGARAFAMAGISVADVDVAQLYDSFTITVGLTLEALGFCDRGGFGDLVRSGAIDPGGALPLNTSGGGLSYCHPGQFGILLVVEAVRQLRGEAGERQVPDVEVALTHGTGGILSHHATTILGIDR